MTWADVSVDPELLIFIRSAIDAAVERETIALRVACERVEYWRQIAFDLHDRLRAAETSGQRRTRSNRERQAAHRRRRQFMVPILEAPLEADVREDEQLARNVNPVKEKGLG